MARKKIAAYVGSLDKSGAFALIKISVINNHRHLLLHSHFLVNVTCICTAAAQIFHLYAETVCRSKHHYTEQRFTYNGINNFPRREKKNVYSS